MSVENVGVRGRLLGFVVFVALPDVGLGRPPTIEQARYLLAYRFVVVINPANCSPTITISLHLFKDRDGMIIHRGKWLTKEVYYFCLNGQSVITWLSGLMANGWLEGDLGCLIFAGCHAGQHIEMGCIVHRWSN
ncbi:hypothetical protein F5J12DRAFT_877771 [Pisolithus orientalis]|uniref:uncharacterized protein n=1 Tax=Pisolithus orientalis TaxID=936130 RepID=UPI002224FE82|nr:uncharacterized protein F5J12DRAFT_877771 [Pisolithus orientalis]KAI5982083.1 hypothetical protein F5J12DRAFT_877771 [Pisolithus orientalis]